MTDTAGLPFAVSEVTGMIAASRLRSPTSDEACLVLFHHGASPASTPARCLVRPGAIYSAEVGEFSPDGQLLLILALRPVHASRPFVALLDANTEEVLLRFDEGHYGFDRDGAQRDVTQATFEDDQHVLLVVRDRTGRTPTRARGAIVRCDVTARTCELATTPQRWSFNGHRPYGLAG